jgi:hypothetical protein
VDSSSGKATGRTTRAAKLITWSVQDAAGLGCIGRQQVHQRRRQAIVVRQAKFGQAGTHGRHVCRLGARLDDGGDECRELHRRPARFAGQFGMHEIETMERMDFVFDAADHVRAAGGAGVALDGRAGIDDRQLLSMRNDVDLLAGNDGDLREQGAFRLPALGATACVVERGLGLACHFDAVGCAVAGQPVSRKAGGGRRAGGANGGMDRDVIVQTTMDQLRRVLYIGSFSKTLASGLRVGYLAASRERIEWILAHKIAANIANSSLSERVVYRLLSQGGYRNHCAQLRSRLDELRLPLVEQLVKHGFGIDHVPSGGMYVCAQLPGKVDATDVATRMLAQGHLMAPGGMFSHTKQWKTSMRFNVGHSLDSPALPALVKLLGRRG